MSSRLAMQTLANLLLTLVVLTVGTRLHHISLSAGTYGLILMVSILGGAVFLSIGQALVGLVKSADSVNAAARGLVLALLLLGTLSQSGTLGTTWESIARWSPVGAVMTLLAAVLNLSAWDTHDSLALLACGGYIVLFSGIGIRWFQWNSRMKRRQASRLTAQHSRDTYLTT